MPDQLNRNKIIYWLLPILYILLAQQFITGYLGIVDNLTVATIYKGGFAALLLTGLVFSKTLNTVGLNASIKITVIPTYWPFILLIGWQFFQVEALPQSEVIGKLILMTFSIGFIEEVIFRGLVFYWLRNFSQLKVIILSALIFGLFHGLNILNGDAVLIVLMQVFVAFAIGLVFAVARFQDSSLWLLIIVHMLIDFSDYLGTGLEASQLSENSVIEWMLPGVIIFTWALWLIYRLPKKSQLVSDYMPDAR
jgi:membrane protease YdiL (CAAX protease family)